MACHLPQHFSGPPPQGAAMDLETLRERLAELNDAAQALRARAEAERRDLSGEEAAELDRLLADFSRTEADIDRLERLNEQSERMRQGPGRRTKPDMVGRQPSTPAPDEDEEEPRPPSRTAGRLSPGGSSPRPSLHTERKGGFRSLGELAISIAHASRQGSYPDPRLDRLAPSNVANEGTGAEGGFAVPPDFRTSIMEKVMGEASLLSRTDQVPVAGNTLTVPKDNGTPWGTTGIRAYWGAEGGLKTSSRPAFETMTLRLNKVYALVPVTDELLEDAVAMDAYIRRKAPEVINFAINLAIVQGTGNMQPLGIVGAPGTVSVAKESSQVADTVVANNILKMWSRLYAPCRQNAVWLINQDIEPMLYTLSLPGKDNTGAAATGYGSHVFMPAGGLSGSPYSTLMGRPVIPTQACETLGDLGDIVLADLSKYLTAVKNGGKPRQDVSMHLWFDYDVTAFRFVLRMTGQPWWDAPISPRDGSNPLSAFVTLDERA